MEILIDVLEDVRCDVFPSYRVLSDAFLIASHLKVDSFEMKKVCVSCRNVQG